MQATPISYAEKITELLADEPFAVSDAALQIARTLLVYKVRHAPSVPESDAQPFFEQSPVGAG
jgi:hypothetical protein